MNYEKDYSLLRPFDLEAAKRGEKICTILAEYANREFVAGPDDHGYFCVKTDDGWFRFGKPDEYRMSPLAWVEGRPVYKADVLYSTYSSIKGEKRTIIGIVETDVLDCEESTCCPDSLTWQKPKTKREGWVNIYPNKNKYMCRYDTKQDAESNADRDVIASVRITWEE